MTTRAIIYARVSTEDQVEKFGLPVQYRECKAFAARNGYTVLEIISDDGVSGATLDRPGLTRVRDKIRAGECDVVLMLDVDRLSRELAHLLILKPEIEKRARMEFVNATFEDSPSGRLFFNVRGVFAQYERENMMQRVMRGKREAARAGRIVGGRIAYGYSYQDGAITPDPERAPFVRQIFEWCAAGVPVRQIALRLRAGGAPTWSGKKWGRSTVRRMLSNETYAGLAHFGTHKREGRVLRLRNPEERISLAVPHLISREQWDRVQARLMETLPVGRPSVTSLLRGLVVCPCGRHMNGSTGKKDRAYRCNGRDPMRHQGERCTRRVSGPKIDQAVWNTLLAAFTEPGALRRILRAYQSGQEMAGPERLDALRRQLRLLEVREERCLSLMVDSELAGAAGELKRRYLSVQRDRQAVARELAQVEAAGKKREGADAWLDRVTYLLGRYLPTLEAPAEKQAFVQAMVSRVVWDGAGSAQLHCFLGAEMANTCLRSGLFSLPGLSGNSHSPSLSDLASDSIQIILTARFAA